MKKKNWIFFIFTLLTLLLVPLEGLADSGSESSNVLTLPDCIAMANTYSYKAEAINKNLDLLNKQYKDLLESSRKVQMQMDLLKVEEQEETSQYLEFLFNNYVQPRDFPHYAMWTNIENMRINREVAEKSIESGVVQVYCQILNLEDNIRLQCELHANMKKQNGILAEKYEQGRIAELDKYLSDIRLEQHALEITKLKRMKENLEMLLKQQIGMPLSQPIELNPEIELITAGTETDAGKLKPYRHYINSTLKKRAEIVISSNDLNVKQREYDIIRKYITNETADERIESEAALDEKKIAHLEAKNKVAGDISAAFADARIKRKNIQIADENRKNAARIREEAASLYDQGMITLSELWDAELEIANGEIGYRTAVRDYNLTLYRLELASGAGPGYNP